MHCLGDLQLFSAYVKYILIYHNMIHYFCLKVYIYKGKIKGSEP